MATTVLVQLEFVQPFLLHLDFPSLTQKLEVWRLLTNFCFFGPFGMPFVFSLFFMVRYGRELEAKRFEGRAGDFLWALILMGLVQVAVAFAIVPLPFLAQGLLSSIVYLWSREYADQVLSIFGLFNVQGFYFPWVLVAIRVLMGGSPVDDLVGIFAGHCYYFCEDVQNYKLTAPRLLSSLVDTATPVAAAQQRNRNMFGNHNFGGAGQALGR